MISGTSAAAIKNNANRQYAQVQPIRIFFAERKYLTTSDKKLGRGAGKLCVKRLCLFIFYPLGPFKTLLPFGIMRSNKTPREAHHTFSFYLSVINRMRLTVWLASFYLSGSVDYNVFKYSETFFSMRASMSSASARTNFSPVTASNNSM